MLIQFCVITVVLELLKKKSIELIGIDDTDNLIIINIIKYIEETLYNTKQKKETFKEKYLLNGVIKNAPKCFWEDFHESI